jgi:ceramide glucosyltransferase
MFVFYIFWAIVFCLGLLSLVSGFRWLRYIREELEYRWDDYTPFATIIVPCRGIDPDFSENISSLFDQAYPGFEIIFVTDSISDPSVEKINELRRSNDYLPSRLVVSGRTSESGQKIHNLLAATKEVDARSEVLLFYDTDVKVTSNWLRNLVAPLQDLRIGASTGYRWYAPKSFGLASQLRSCWNASIASALGSGNNFCWGGSTAILKSTFSELKIAEHWRGAVSDDFVITSVLKRNNLRIHFVPSALSVSREECTIRELLEFTTRQIKITRVYSPAHWKNLLISSLLFTAVLTTALLLSIKSIYFLPFVLAVLCLGVAKSVVRLKGVSMILGDVSVRDIAAHFLGWPFATFLYLYNCIVASFSRRITWRGISYHLKSAKSTVILTQMGD